MSDPDSIAILTRMADTLDAIREDLKRRSERDLKSTGSIPATSRPSTSGATFPNYGRSKNAPVSGASIGDLEYYAAGCRRTLDDPAKSRWHSKERDLLAAIDAEIARQGGTAPPREEAPPDFGGGLVGEDDLPF